MNYTIRDTVNIKGQIDVDVEITGTIVFDDGAWHHHACEVVKLKMYDGKYKSIIGEAATVIYDNFCREWPADGIACKGVAA